MFKRILIANRGEAAVRIIRACRDMGIETVSIHSTVDSEAMHTRLADQTICVGPPRATDSYLNVHAILTAAQMFNADAIHPGIGFLAEDANFARTVIEHGLVFIGPDPQQIEDMGDKIQAIANAGRLGLQTVPGSHGLVESLSDAIKVGQKIGYPLLIKAAAGGGGRGIRMVDSPSQLAEAFESCRGEASAIFNNADVYMERYFSSPRHIEVQVIGDGSVVAHLGIRDCSLQRRRQKILEEAQSPGIELDVSRAICEQVSQAMHRYQYKSAGTLEFLYQDGEFFFIEMNTRLQVEHPISEVITGVDLVKEQIRVAAGLALSLKQEDIVFRGHAIECRINAEDPETFTPSPGVVKTVVPAGGPGVRVDSALFDGAIVPPFYDNLLAKLIVYGNSREEAVQRARRALGEYVITGVKTNIDLHLQLLESPDFIRGDYDVQWLEKNFLVKK